MCARLPAEPGASVRASLPRCVGEPRFEGLALVAGLHVRAFDHRIDDHRHALDDVTAKQDQQPVDLACVRLDPLALEGIALYDTGDYLIPDFLGVAFTADEQKVYDRTWGTIRDYMLERQQSWILGNGDVMADWDDYIAQLDHCYSCLPYGSRPDRVRRQLNP